MKLIFIGPQGSGKGTQAKILSKKLEYCHISMGDLLRDAQGELKKKINEIINKGNLVPVEITVNLLKQRLNKEDCKKGVIFDGFPRNQEQANELDKITKIDKIFDINISDEEAIKRLSGRLNCKKCGAIYNIHTMPPKKQGICDKCGGELYQRDDDKPEAIKRRLEVYHEETEPLLKKYDYVKIDGKQDVEKVTEDILKNLNL